MALSFPGDFEFSVAVPDLEIARPESTFLVLPEQGPKGDKGDPGSLDDLSAVQDMIDTSVTTHVNAPTPHPAYDDIVDLTLVFNNGLV